MRTTQKAFAEAKEQGADIILIHMNTYGGLVDAADSIRTKILNSDIPVYVFIDNNAASAGALIAIACDSIYMAPVASIGAATVVDQTGKPVPDKYQSYMRSWMRSTAEATGRDPDIAQAMVDPDIYIAGIVDTGKVLTLTTSEAIRYGYCEGRVENIAELMDDAHIPRYEIISHKKTGADKIIGWLISPIRQRHPHHDHHRRHIFRASKPGSWASRWLLPSLLLYSISRPCILKALPTTGKSWYSLSG